MKGCTGPMIINTGFLHWLIIFHDFAVQILIAIFSLTKVLHTMYFIIHILLQPIAFPKK